MSGPTWSQKIPEMSAKLPGMPLEEDEEDFQVVTNKPAPDFEILAAAALENVGIDTRDCQRTTRDTTETAGGGLPGSASANVP
jgi:hypothetical protein